MKSIESIEIESRPTHRRKTVRSKVVRALVLSLLVCLVACVCFVAGVAFQSDHSQSEAVPTIDSVQIVDEVQSIGELATVKYIYTDMGKFEDTQQFQGYDIPLTTKSFILSWNGTIKAGIDASEIGLDVDEASKTILVRIPSAKILSHETDESSVRVFDESNNVFNPITLDDYSTFFATSKSEMEQRALDSGILDEAIENAESVILRILESDETISSLYTVSFEVSDG